MAIQFLAWVVAIPLLGFLTGLRSMTPIAILCLFSLAGNLEIHHSWAFWTARPVTSIVFCVLALGEYVGDKLPKTPNRTAPFPLLARVIFGGLVGAISAAGLHGPELEGILLGCLGAVAGAFVGFYVRDLLVKRRLWPDLWVALGEDALTIGLSVIAMGIITG